MKPLPFCAVFTGFLAVSAISECSGEPSQTDIREMLDVRQKQTGNVVLHEVKKIGCKDSGEPQKGMNFYCNVEVELGWRK